MLPETFSALGNPVRLAIVERLLKQGAQPVSQLADVAPISAPALSRHLKVLREAGIIDQSVDAQRRLCSVRPEALSAVEDWTLNWRDFWSGSLDRLEASFRKDRT